MTQERKRAVLYARVSTEAQASEDKTSLDSQLDACRALAAGQGWEVVAEYRDDSTGYSLDRRGLDEVRRLVRERSVDLVVAYKQERISRSQTDTGTLYGEFQRAKVRIWTVQEGTFESSPLGQFITGAFAFVAEMDRANRAEATSRGQREKVRKQRVLGSSPRAKYGYDFVYAEGPNGSRIKVAYKVNEAEAATVREVYRRTLAGEGTREIAADLNRRRVPTAYAGDERYDTSGEWTSQSVRRLLRSEHYKGGAHALVHKRREGEDGKRRGAIFRDLSNAVMLGSEVVPPIVEVEDWNRAQAVLTARALPPAGTHDTADIWLRGGLVQCGVCGGNMVIGHNRQGKRYLKCTRSGRETGACGRPSPTILVEALEPLVWSNLRSNLLDPYLLWDRFGSVEQADTGEAESETLRGQLAELEARRARLLRSLEVLDEADLPDLRARLAELAEQREGLRTRIADLQAQDALRAEERSWLFRVARWLDSEPARIDALTAAERRHAALELGLVVRVFPTGTEERFRVDYGYRPVPGTFFEGVDWAAVTAPTLEQRRETARILAEANERGQGAALVARLLDGPIATPDATSRTTFAAWRRSTTTWAACWTSWMMKT